MKKTANICCGSLYLLDIHIYTRIKAVVLVSQLLNLLDICILSSPIVNPLSQQTPRSQPSTKKRDLDRGIWTRADNHMGTHYINTNP